VFAGEGQPRGGRAHGCLLRVLAVLVLTGSRSGFLTAALLLGVSLLATRSWKLNLVLSAAALPVLVAFVVVIESRYSGGKAALSDMGRLWTYLAAVEMIKANPFLGVGFGNILDAYQDYGRIYAALMGRPLDIHNAFLEIFAESGVVALILYTLLLGVPFMRLARRVAADSRDSYPLVDLVGLNICIIYIVHGMVYP
jgi:O-antigen ligase